MKTKHMISMSLFALASAFLTGCATSPVGECPSECPAPVSEIVEPVNACPAPVHERIEYRTLRSNCY